MDEEAAVAGSDSGENATYHAREPSFKDHFERQGTGKAFWKNSVSGAVDEVADSPASAPCRDDEQRRRVAASRHHSWEAATSENVNGIKGLWPAGKASSAEAATRRAKGRRSMTTGDLSKRRTKILPTFDGLRVLNERDAQASLVRIPDLPSPSSRTRKGLQGLPTVVDEKVASGGGDEDDNDEPPAFSWSLFFAYTGPGWLMSIAYVDPGNLESDLQAGAFSKYQLLWVLLSSTLIGLLFQVLAVRLGAVTGRDLAETCRLNFSSTESKTLWLMTQVAIIGSDIQEIVGSAVAFRVLFGLPLWAGCLLTGLDTLSFLMIHYLGVRKLEAFFGVLIYNVLLLLPPSSTEPKIGVAFSLARLSRLLMSALLCRPLAL